ncbi:hypothetical protein V5O48_014685 [Marasmius crinis-equi]|uniref:DUF6535 domain-containing protein n=1 Tax=Marasmius crinis-equi TaxID=585013 RepID=A0ABR3EWL4_9AGAR
MPSVHVSLSAQSEEPKQVCNTISTSLSCPNRFMALLYIYAQPSTSGGTGKSKEVLDSEDYDYSLEQSWEDLTVNMRKYDNELVNGWKQDIDTLLVFAGLFSAVVTAFTVESYKWLSEDPVDTTVILLSSILSQLSGVNFTIPPVAPQFQPTPSSVRINSFWFLSLILSLASSLFSLLCKQWLREHRRETHTRTQQEAQALRQLRRDSFDRWGVPTFLATLPFLLEVSLLLFFAGLLELLWTLHVAPLFTVGGTAIISGTGLYLITTFLPGVTAIASLLRDIQSTSKHPRYELMCPYKSPLTWVVFRMLGRFVSTDTISSFFHLTVAESKRRWIEQYTRYLKSDIRRLIDWSTLDLNTIQRWRWHDGGANIYSLASLQSLVTTLRDSPSALSSMKSVLRSFPPSEITTVAFNEWKFSTWLEPTAEDIEDFLPDTLPTRLSRRRQTIGFTSSNHLLKSASTFRLLTLNWDFLTNTRFLCCSYEKYAYYPSVLVSNLERALRRSTALLQRNVPEHTGMHFIIPFYVMERFWTHPDHRVRMVGLEYLRFYEAGWLNYPKVTGAGVEESEGERYTLVATLSRHLSAHAERSILDCSPTKLSALLTSWRGLKFLVFVNDQILAHRLHNTTLGTRKAILDSWTTCLVHVREMYALPSDYFRSLGQ